MFSVDDLLISHGYKLPKSPTNSSEVAGDQHEDTVRRSNQATRNGLPIHPGAIPKTNKTKRYQLDNKNNADVRGWPRNTHHEHFSGPGIMQGGPYDQSVSRSSSSKKEKDFASWKGQCQDFSAYDYPGRVDNEMRKMGAACALFGDENKAHWETEKGLENMRSNKQEAMKPPGDYRRQSLKTDTWKQPIAFGQPESDTDNKKRPLQIVYSGRKTFTAFHVKNKSQPFPRFISSANTNYAEIPAIASSKQQKVKPELESLKYSEPATRPKYGRPLKPPSYEFHQQSRGIVETNPPQDEQQKHTFYGTNVEELEQDSTLGPPLYIPPPSYKSGQQSKNQHVPKEVPDYDEPSVRETQVLDQGIHISSGSFVNQLQMKDEVILISDIQVMYQDKQLSSVQYIPFDDPRIRHIKVIYPADHHQMEDHAEDANNSSVFRKNSVDKEFSNLNVDVPESVNITVNSNQVSDRRLVESNADQDSGALSTQKGSYDTGNSPNCVYLKAKSSDQSPCATEPSTETVTKVKTFEPGTEIQDKNHLKKKINETMFCLVALLPEFQRNMPGFDRNNNAIQGSSENYDTDSNRDLKEQSFLSMSSTDLELQALTGNMLNTTVSEKDFQRPGFKQVNCVSSKQPPKHKELEYSGSGPCTTYKNQETQTTFKEESQIQQPLNGSQQPLQGPQLKKSNTLTNGHFLKYGSSTTESAPSSLPTDNRKGRPIPPPRKTQFNKSSKSECPRTVVNSKTGQDESHTTSTGLPGQKHEPSFARKEENKSPCSIKEAFGQFLLKPVGRRPWDAISELENINKEIQKQEEGNEDNKENKQKQEREEDKKVNKAEVKACRVDEVSQDHGCSAETRKVKPDTFVLKKEIKKSKPESENSSKISNTRDVFNVGSEAREMDKSVKRKSGNGLNQRQDNARKIIEQAISLHPMKSKVFGCSDSENSKPLNSINSRETSIENHNDSGKLKKPAGKNSPNSKAVSVAPLSIKRRNQGCSEPNLRPVDLDVNEGTSIPDSSTKKISSNESLHTRASRILGIEVPVESLTADNKTLSTKDTNNMAQSCKLSNKKTPKAEMKTNVASSKGKPKGGWLKSTFIGEKNLGPVKNQCSGEEKLTREQYFQQHPDLGKHQEDHAPSFESSVLPLAERKSLPSNVERKTESISKVAVPRLGKVASAVSRAAMDRIVRMKEVNSVSRMRRLIIKNAGSGEDRDEDKQVKEPEGKANDFAICSTDFPRKLSQGSCVSKRIISLNENEHLGNKNPKKSGTDLPSSEVYDPSQVERV